MSLMTKVQGVRWIIQISSQIHAQILHIYTAALKEKERTTQCYCIKNKREKCSFKPANSLFLVFLIRYFFVTSQNEQN